jgi:hypothetical protein
MEGLNENQNYLQDVRRKTMRIAAVLADDDDQEAEAVASAANSGGN